MRLKNKSVIVTGSCTGIGKAIAERCVQEGARVIINGLEQEDGEGVVNRLGNTNAELHIEDITLDGAPGRLVDKAVQTFGKLDAVVNNAAMVHSSNIRTTDLPLFRKILEVNSLAPFALIQTALPYLEKTGGNVVNIGSINAWGGEPDLMAYSVSKGALMTLTRNLGETLLRDHGVRVNQINPGWVLTKNEIRRKREHGLPDDWYENLPEDWAPSGRLLYPDEIAEAVLYYLSDAAGPVSGQVLDLEQYPFIGRNLAKDVSSIAGGPKPKK